MSFGSCCSRSAQRTVLLTRLRNIGVLTMAAVTAACAQVKILSAEVARINSDSIIVALVTNKDLRQYDNTIYAHHVYLSYRPSSTVVSSEFENPSKPWTYPFDVSLSGSQACGPGRHCSSWTIPIANSSNLDLNDYTYVLRHADNVRLKIGGGSIGGGRLTSNVVVVGVP